MGVAGTAAALASGVSTSAQAREDGFGTVVHDDYPVELSPEYKRFSEYNTTIFRDARKGIPDMNPSIDDSRPGFTTSEFAMSMASTTLYKYMYTQEPGLRLETVHQPHDVLPEPHKFADSATAHAQIKRVARHFGASVVGITRHDERWDYSELVDPHDIHDVRPWEERMAGFKPKTMIVIGVEMEYEALAAAPSLVSDATVLNAYSGLTYTLMHLSNYFNYLGYKTIPAMSGVSLHIPYAIAAGLGEINRMGLLQNYKYGTRLRLSTLYTDLELDEYYDKPVTFGIQDFCENCMHCADKCPSKTIPRDIKPTFYTSEDTKGRPYMSYGIKKWQIDGQKCHDYWIESGTTCGTCLATCPYNKPDFWHHRLIDRLNTILPGPIHKFMAQMDLWHGYGDTFDEKAPAVFWDPKGRSYNGLKG
ncbi:reductive dehalogenase [Sansalvadorimonas verongulae]|nr:reductive dehalogenase [Sansalvadorimonas verongulae]